MRVDVEIVFLLVPIWASSRVSSMHFACVVPSGLWGCGVVGVAGVAVADHLAEYLRSTGFRMLVFLKTSAAEPSAMTKPARLPLKGSEA